MHIRQKAMDRSGVTLIEVLMYVGFFVLLVGTLLGIAYQTIASANQINKKIALQQEADFILRKIDWVLTGAQTIAVGPKPSDMVVGRFSAPYSVIFSQNAGFISLDRGLGAVELNSQNVVVSNLSFLQIQPPSESEEIQVSFNLANAGSASAGQNFKLTKYLRQ